MIRYKCCPLKFLPEKPESGIEYILLYNSRSLAKFEVGDVALDLKSDVRRSGLQPSVEAWDFCSISMAVAAIDEAAPRNESVDGWTRVIEAEINLSEPLIWQNQIPQLEQTLRFLTGDFWKLSLVDGGEPPPTPRIRKARNADCISLLSGGVDSLVGAIDLTKSGKSPIFVSKIVRGDKDFQTEIANRLGIAENHIQWRYNSRSNSEGENSTRGRSLIFFAYAALVASSQSGSDSSGSNIDINVPENGFISLNLPLTPLRQGTLSTKTTHPVYLAGLQRIWNDVGIQGVLISPFKYCFRTKGEILDRCLDKELLRDLVGKSTSCGRYGYYNQTHCGRCIPCLVRRAAFLRADLPDLTLETNYKGKQCQYVFSNLAAASKEETSNDIRAAGRACIQVESNGVENFIAGGLAFASPQARPNYASVVERGIKELRNLLEQHQVL